MTPQRRRAFAQKWTDDRETLFSEDRDEPPSKPPPALSKSRPWTSMFNYILDGRIRIEPTKPAHWLNQQWCLWGYKWNRFSRKWSALRLFHCREFELEDDPTI